MQARPAGGGPCACWAVVFAYCSDPWRAGAGTSYTNHRPNVVGTVSTSPLAEQLDLARRITPALSSVGLVFHPSEANASFEAELLRREASQWPERPVSRSAPSHPQGIDGNRPEQVEAEQHPQAQQERSGQREAIAMAPEEERRPWCRQMAAAKRAGYSWPIRKPTSATTSPWLKLRLAVMITAAMQ